jgi:hypothetical protein
VASKATANGKGRVSGESVQRRTMRATTVRFGADLWEMLEREAELSGVSVAQYVRESALARLAFAAAQRGDLSPWAESARGRATGMLTPEVSDALRDASHTLKAQAEALASRSTHLSEAARETLHEESQAVLAQSRQVMRESERIRKEHSRER